MTYTTEDTKLFECAYCGALVRARIIPEKCKECGKSSFLTHYSDLKDDNIDRPKEKDYVDEN
jgi:predicted  nucleic acid-binding Zn-ribbon protein